MRSAIGRWALGVGRWTFAATAALLIVSCSSAPRRSTVHYSPPSVAPVRSQVADAQTLSVALKASIAKAQSLVGPDSVDPANVPLLREDLAEAFGLTNDLWTKLQGAQKAVDELEKKAGAQTDSLNTCVDDKNTAIDRADRIAKQAAITEKKYHRLKGGVCGLGAAAVAWLIWKLGLFRLVSSLSILGPWGFGAAIAVAVGVPGIVFGILWSIL